MGFLESRQTLKTARAYRLKLSFQHLFNQNKGEAAAFLKDWYYWATHSRLEPMIKAAQTIREHQEGVLRWFQSRVTFYAQTHSPLTSAMTDTDSTPTYRLYKENTDTPTLAATCAAAPIH